MVGRELVLDLPRLENSLRTHALKPETSLEIGRYERLHKHLAEVRTELAARRIRIESPTNVAAGFAELPAGIHLRRGQLVVDFDGGTDLLSKLLALSQAAMNDFSRFEGLCEGDTPMVL